jgi:hypothetical protein
MQELQQQQSPDNTVTSSCLSHLFYLFIFSFFFPHPLGVGGVGG